MLLDDTVKRWQERRDAWRATGSFRDWQERRRSRDEVRPAICALLSRFLDGETDLTELRDTFHAEARGSWSCHDLHGSAVFLNCLHKHVSDTAGLTELLRESLRVPASASEARARIRSLIDFLDRGIEAGDIRRADVQPNRAVSFLSSSWRILDPRWIALWRPARKVLAREGLLEIGDARADAYEPYVELVRELAGALALDVEDLEGLCAWVYGGDETPALRPNEGEGGDSEPTPAGPRVWLISPGRGASAWEEHYAAGVIAIGWERLGDLGQYASLDEVNARIRALRGDERNPVNDANACFSFGHRMRPGDIVFAKRGRSEIIGAGVITGEYEHVPEQAPFVHRRAVIWTHKGQGRPQNNGLVMKTLTEITVYTGLVRACADVFETTIEGIALAAGRPVAASPESGDPESPAQQIYTSDDALAEVFLDADDLGEMIELLRARRNLVLQGPPGTGKTFLASCLARVLIGSRSEKQVCRVQFHQSMSYEDFVQGYRPDGSGFSLRTGPFLRFCNEALQDRDNAYVLIIDEINRGNLSRILGELMLLIEHDKRGPEWAVTLAYAGADDEPTWVPPNLYIIGTMNTADRSLALVDYALRRRFAFMDVPSAVGHARFRAYLAERGVDPGVQDWITTRIPALNRRIRDDANLGEGFAIGHSYFCSGGTDERWYERVIRHELLPLLREYWFDAPGQVDALAAELLDAD